jgi:hypothetical protein
MPKSDMNRDTEKEKDFWKKIDRNNKKFQSNNALFFGVFLIIFFSYESIKLYQSFSNYNEFQTAIRYIEKVRSLGFLFAISIGIFFIWFGLKIRKMPIKDNPTDLL